MSPITRQQSKSSSQVANVVAKLLVIYTISAAIAPCQATSTTNSSLKIFLNPRTSHHNVTSTTIPPSSPASPTTSKEPGGGVQTRNSSADSSAWIESILIKIESLKLDGDQLHAKLLEAFAKALDKRAEDRPEQRQQQQASGSTEAEGLLLAVSASQAPTDSGEDPLETTTIETGDASKPPVAQSSATHYTIAEDGDPDDDLKLVDSNNVSAVLATDAAQETSAQTNSRASLITMAPRQTSLTCSQAYTQCTFRKVCEPALRAYHDDCHDLINNRTDQCSAKCLKAMIALRSSEEGDDLANCDCQEDEHCINSKLRSQACKPQVDKAVDPKTNVSCSTATQICLADQLCSTALEYYYRNCGSLFSQQHCSPACNNSLSILYRQPKAFKLVNCHCDGSEEFPCTAYKTYTERLCLNKMPTQTDADHELTGQAPEEEGFNLTNDPETHIFNQPSSSSFATGAVHFGQDADEEGTHEGVKPNSSPNDHDSAPETEDLSSADNNGIQPVEDDWIPLMSGRFFTNLHQQQRAKQLQQQQQQRQQGPKQSTHVAMNHGQRKQKQKSRSTNSAGNHENRRRHSRLSALSSTSSSAPSYLPPVWWIVAAPASSSLALPLLMLSSCLFFIV